MLAFIKQIINQQVLVAIGLFSLGFPCWATFSIIQANIYLENNFYKMDAKLNYHLTEPVKEALHNGVTITLELLVNIERERRYFWNENIATLKQGYRLKYHALTEHYLINYLNTGTEETFPKLETALDALGNLEGFPLLDSYLIDPKSVYWVYLHTYLNIEALPVPLRPTAYLSSQWRLSSEWYSCPLHPLKSKHG